MLFLSVGASAQNLVPNPGFEDFNNCPTMVGSLNNISYSSSYSDFPTVKNWISPLTTSPDYYNKCNASSDDRGVPRSRSGTQSPHGGNAYAGIAAHFTDPGLYDDFREYLEAKLNQQMIAEHSYYVSFYVNLATCNRAFYTIMAADRIGCVFSDTLIHDSLPPLSPNNYLSSVPSVSSPAGWHIADTLNWVRIEGIYRAHGGESWITIGHFKASVESADSFVLTSPLLPYVWAAYLFVDDVCLVDMDNHTDTTVFVAKFPFTLAAVADSNSYSWSTGETASSIDISQPGIYWRRTTGPCYYRTDTFHVTQISEDECLWAPSAFSPNYDGINDRFNVVARCPLQQYRINIYNRWGNLVFRSSDISEGWDGTFNGVRQDMGAYYYFVEYTPSISGQNNRLMKKGSITLI